MIVWEELHGGGDKPAAYEPRVGGFKLTIYPYQIAYNEPLLVYYTPLPTKPKTNTNIINYKSEEQE